MTDLNKQADEQFPLPHDLAAVRHIPTDLLAANENELTDTLPADQPPVLWVLLRELVETVVLSLIIFLLIRQGVQNYRIESRSMEPNFYDGEFILVNKLAYKLGQPHHGDVVVFHNPGNTDQDYIKRIVGLPGDTVDIREGKVFVNGQPLDEPYVRQPTDPRSQTSVWVIEPNHLFVMGDNRPNSSDSRSFPEQLSQDLMVGKAWLRIWPFARFGLVEHYDNTPTTQLSSGP